jgi:23S rRNA (adenine2503-C2)-methyltransferase
MSELIKAPELNSYSWDNVKQIQSQDKNVTKFVFENSGSSPAVAEAVLYKYPEYEDRTVICCSTQSGCPVGCRFCGAGDNFVRSLSSQEIIDQPKYILDKIGVDTEKIKKLQIMFMSMGEPMLNIKRLIPAIRELNNEYPNAALLISSSGPRVDYSDFIEISKDINQIGLQFSVHESSDLKRNQLIPFVAKLSLYEIAEKGEEWAQATGRKPFFNYCVHDANDTAEDVSRLKALFDPAIWQATLSVVCERDESVARSQARQQHLVTNFMAKMLVSGYNVRLFDPAGQDDIGGGCGQLWFVQEWMKNNQEHARPSAGRNKPIIHSPK